MSRSDIVGPFHYGQIVLARVPDGHGNTKIRPVVIVTPTDKITSEKPILAVCVSTQIEEPMPSEHVKLPWSNPRHPRTGLNKPNVAKCNWIVAFPQSSIVEVKGIVPARPMAEIKEVLRRLAAEEEGA